MQVTKILLTYCDDMAHVNGLDDLLLFPALYLFHARDLSL